MRMSQLRVARFRAGNERQRSQRHAAHAYPVEIARDLPTRPNDATMTI
jgi:hypothetical protein